MKCMANQTIEHYAEWVGSAKRIKAQEAGLVLRADGFATLSGLPSFGMHEGEKDLLLEGEEKIKVFGCAIWKMWLEKVDECLGHIYAIVFPRAAWSSTRRSRMIQFERSLRATTDEDRLEFGSKNIDWLQIESGQALRKIASLGIHNDR